MDPKTAAEAGRNLEDLLLQWGFDDDPRLRYAAARVNELRQERADLRTQLMHALRELLDAYREIELLTAEPPTRSSH